jgi:hypothetical protein
MKVNKNQFEKFGKPYNKGDVVGCFFSVKGKRVGVGWTVNGEDMGGEIFQVDVEKVSWSSRLSLKHLCLY